MRGNGLKVFSWALVLGLVFLLAASLGHTEEWYQISESELEALERLLSEQEAIISELQNESMNLSNTLESLEIQLTESQDMLRQAQSTISQFETYSTELEREARLLKIGITVTTASLLAVLIYQIVN